MEIEIRAFVDDFEKLRVRLSQLGSKKVEDTKIKDVWFCKNDVQSYEGTKMNKVGSYGLRVRTINDKTELTVKTIINEGDHQIFGEFETGVDSPDEILKILSALGFKQFCVVDKKRESYELEGMTINLEDIKGFKPCIEIEIIADGNFSENKDKIHQVLDMLDIPEENRIDTSITSLYMEENSIFE
jgi:predicted adenylyl cyclase CyaB